MRLFGRQLLHHIDILITLAVIFAGMVNYAYGMKEKVDTTESAGIVNTVAIQKIVKADEKRDKKIDRMDYNIQLIAEQLKVPYLRKNNDERPTDQ